MTLYSLYIYIQILYINVHIYIYPESPKTILVFSFSPSRHVFELGNLNPKLETIINTRLDLQGNP